MSLCMYIHTINSNLLIRPEDLSLSNRDDGTATSPCRLPLQYDERRWLLQYIIEQTALTWVPRPHAGLIRTADGQVSVGDTSQR